MSVVKRKSSKKILFISDGEALYSATQSKQISSICIIFVEMKEVLWRWMN